MVFLTSIIFSFFFVAYYLNVFKKHFQLKVLYLKHTIFRQKYDTFKYISIIVLLSNYVHSKSIPVSC